MIVGALLVVAGACSGSSGKVAPSTNVLRDGFHVPAGARLVGPVMPDLTSFVFHFEASGQAPRSAWVANFAVHGKARSVYRDLAAQARRAGFASVDPAPSACRETPDAGAVDVGGQSAHQVVVCSGHGGDAAYPGGRNLEIEVARCSRCNPTVGLARVVYDEGSGTGPGLRVVPLHVAQVNPLPARQNHWADVAGTRVMVNSWFYACQLAQLAVLSVTGDPDQVWQEALDRALPIVRAVRSTIRGHRIRQAFAADGSDQQSITMDEGAEGSEPTLSSWYCEG